MFFHGKETMASRTITAIIATAALTTLAFTPAAWAATGSGNTADDGIGMWVGGDYTSTAWEIEGVSVINGDAHVVPGNPQGGHALWGMGYPGAADADVFNVGGNLTPASGSACTPTTPFVAAGSIKVGGSVADGCRIAKPDDYFTGANGADGKQQAYTNPSTRSPVVGVGHDKALHVDMGGGDVVDYTGFAAQVSAVSDDIAARSDTGTTRFSTGHDSYLYEYDAHGGRPVASTKTTIHDTGRVTFTGDGRADAQTFTLDADAMTREANTHGWHAWDFDFENIPQAAAIYVNVTGTAPVFAVSQSWTLNGVDVSVNSDDDGAAKTRFIDLASRLIWNVNKPDSWHVMNPASVPDTVTGPADPRIWLNMPGSILMDHGNLVLDVDQNGRLYANGDVTITSNERHNLPYRWSRTLPQTHPRLHVEKYDARSGFPAGDRDTSVDALTLDGDGTRIMFRVSNTGDVDLSHVAVTDRTIEGTGMVRDVSCPASVLKAGASMDCVGVLSDVAAGSTHGDEATAKATHGGDTVTSNTDRWYGRRIATHDAGVQETPSVPPAPTSTPSASPSTPISGKTGMEAPHANTPHARPRRLAQTGVTPFAAVMAVACVLMGLALAVTARGITGVRHPR